jgi:5-methylcytosine-specific restriction endonuclease McrA
MTQYVPVALAKLVRARAGYKCEYCRLPQSSQEAAFHIDHILPQAAGGATVADNLALACVTCSLRKAARTFAYHPGSKRRAPCSIHGEIFGLTIFAGLSAVVFWVSR